MIKSPSFSIYSAAAGSGKTFTLVKEYLKIILKAPKEDYYKHLLAITFTNRAVKEMKERIVSNLISFSSSSIIENPSVMILQVINETELNLVFIQKKSKKVLNYLLNNYSSFSVETIDSFNHRLIRTFARDLKLSGNFEVSLDVEKLLNEAVELLISKAGEHKEITKTILQFSLEKIDEDKSWDISKEVAEVAKLIFNENSITHLEVLKSKNLSDFKKFKNKLLHKKTFLEKSIFKRSSEVLEKIFYVGLKPEDFLRKTLPNHFEKLTKGNYNVYGNKLLENLQNGTALYKANATENVSSTIVALTPFLLENYTKVKFSVFQYQLVLEILKKLTPLSVINLVNKEIEFLKEDQNILPISDFNSIINAEIKNQPAPFIYERLGEYYRHFFIDEFQDTSLLQWNNLIPLIENAITQQYHDGQQGTLMLVGDVKQSIYRWRGGLPEQFMDLINVKNPFYVDKQTINLPRNYRSKKEIVDFNNEFFTYVSKKMGSLIHQNIYKNGSKQISEQSEGGYLKIEFLDFKNKKEANFIYSKRVLDTVKDLLKEGYLEKDICILTRKKADGIIISTHLQENNINVISSETLLLKQSSNVLFLVHCLYLSLFQSHEKIKIKCLDFLYERSSGFTDKHSYFNSLIKDVNFVDYLKKEFNFSFEEIKLKPLFDSVEYILKRFGLEKNADAYVVGFMDMVFDFSLKPNSSKLTFLEEWEIKKEKASIVISEQINGVQQMTIHKSKGLEFPVVIFPYADLDIYKLKENKTWFPLDNKEFGFKETLIDCGINKIEEFGKEGEIIAQKQKETLELDNLNLLYVTLTRASTQLYVFSGKPSPIKNDFIKTYNQYFYEFLKEKKLLEHDKWIYEFGQKLTNSENHHHLFSNTISHTHHSSLIQDLDLSISSRDAFLWGTDVQEALDSGILVHEYMQKIVREEDLLLVIDDIRESSTLPNKNELIKMLSQIVNHPDLNQLFTSSEKVEVERKIITSKGAVLIPDRLNINEAGEITITDYKTGKYQKKHEVQINNYDIALQEMGYTILEKLLIYCSSKEIEIKKV